MKVDQFGQVYLTEFDLVDLLYRNPNLNLGNYPVLDPEYYNSSVDDFYLELEKLSKYREPDVDIDEFDRINQNKWFMPVEYENFDIAEWVLNQCKNSDELQRCGQELLLFQERNLFPLLCYLKYLVDVMREHKIVWGVGRGSSVASFVLYIIGIHKINSLYYDLSIDEFLK